MTTPNTPPDDQYDLEPAPSAPGSSAAVVTEQQPQRPRNPDGTFAPLPKHPDRLVRMARDLGFSDEEIQTTPTADLRASVSEAAIERLYTQQGRTVATAVEQSQAQPAAVPAAPEPEGLGISEDDYDEGLVGVLKRLYAKIETLEKAHAEMAGHVQASVNQTVTQQIDAEFAKHPDFFGKGNLGDLDPEGPDMARRNAVVAMAKTFKDGTPPQRVAKAVSILYPNLASAPAKAPEKPAEKPEVKRWLEGGLAAPTQRTGAGEPAGVEKAKQSIRQFYRENGVEREPTIADEFLE